METKKFNREDYELIDIPNYRGIDDICVNCAFDDASGCAVQWDDDFDCVSCSKIFVKKQPTPEKLSPDIVGGD